MFFYKLLALGGILLFPTMSFSQDRVQIMDKMMQLLQNGGLPNANAGELNALAQKFNESSVIVRQAETPVAAVDPRFLRTQVAEANKGRVALALCADVQGLRSCPDAGAFLQYMTAQCSDIFLGTINLDEYPGVPTALLKDETFDRETEPRDPNFQIFERSEGTGRFRYVSVMGNVRPDMVATVLCPEDSDSFGHVLRMFPKQ